MSNDEALDVIYECVQNGLLTTYSHLTTREKRKVEQMVSFLEDIIDGVVWLERWD